MNEPQSRKSIFQSHPRITLTVINCILLLCLDLLAGAILLPPATGIPHHYYHHDLKRDLNVPVVWGLESNSRYYTNNLGFRTGQPETLDLEGRERRILVLGDSFIEGVGVNYTTTVVGGLSYRIPVVRFLNAAISSYSPKLYYLKTRYLLEGGLKIHGALVFIDISDIQDEIGYSNFQPVAFLSPGFIARRLDVALRNHSYLYSRLIREALLYALHFLSDGRIGGSPSLVEGGAGSRDEAIHSYYQKRSLWTVDQREFRAWGERGLELARGSMQQLTDLCRAHEIPLTLVVYPWPTQIRAADRNSKQVRFWQDFAARNQIGFIDLFPVFIPHTANAAEREKIIEAFYLKGDVHWNESGSALVASTVAEHFWPDATGLRNDKTDGETRGWGQRFQDERDVIATSSFIKRASSPGLESMARCPASRSLTRGFFRRADPAD